MRKLAALVLFCASTFCHAEQFTYELFEISGSSRRSIAADTISYQPSQIVTRRQDANDPQVLHRELRLPSGFAVGCTDYRKKQPDGFGCWLSRVRSVISTDQYDGFSWEWYDRGIGALYSKRKGGTKVSLQTQLAEEGHSMSRIEFLEDATFQINASANRTPGYYTHELLIFKGSVLAFLPTTAAP